MLTLQTLSFLRSEAGTALLQETEQTIDGCTSDLQALTRLRRRHAPDRAAAALETVRLRRRAERKFTRAGAMFFTRDGLEQASGESVARYCASRFMGYTRVSDLGCGIGGDTIALASVTSTCRVAAVDRDPLRLAIAGANADAAGVSDRIDLLRGDITASPLARCDAAWCDPGRRSGDRRVFDVRRYEPPLAAVLALAVATPALGVKVAPGIRDNDVPAGCEVEFIQDGAALKLAALWLGPLATASRRATLLPHGFTMTAEPVPPLPVSAPHRILYEPAAAVIRAHLVEQLGAVLAATKLDEEIAFLTADDLRPTPFATAYIVDEWMPFNLKALKQRLRTLHAGPVVIKKRGSPLDPQELERELALNGAEPYTLVLTHAAGRHAVLLCHPVSTASAPGIDVDRENSDT